MRRANFKVEMNRKIWSRPILFRKDRERLMEIKETQLLAEKTKIEGIKYIMITLDQILKVLKGRKDGKRKISRKDKVPYRFGRR